MKLLLIILLLPVHILMASTLTDQIIPDVKPRPKDNLTEKEKKKLLPLYDLGVASISSINPDYPGSSEYQFTPIIVPVFTYRGKHFRSDGDGSRARFLNNENLELSMSAGGNFPVNSRENEARRGMKTLGQAVLLGPRLMYFVHRDERSKFFFDVAARTGFSIARTWRGWRGLGYSADIGMNYRHNFGSFEIFSLMFTGIGSYKYHKFFYGVDPEYETSTRPAYQARSGYLGTNVLLAFTKRFSPKLTVFAGGVVMLLKGHVNDESPLFEEDINYRAVLGIKYTFFVSDKKENVDYF